MFTFSYDSYSNTLATTPNTSLTHKHAMLTATSWQVATTT